MSQFDINSTIDLFDNLDNFRAIFHFLGTSLTDAKLSEEERHGAYLCFQITGKILDESLEYIDTLPK